MKLNLVADRIVKDKLYPAFARHQAEPYTQSWREFHRHWPNTVPLRLQEYFYHHGVAVDLYTVDQPYPVDSFYPIALGWFNFELDYLSLLPQTCVQALKQHRLKLLFYYNEGDNPVRIKQRLDSLCQVWQLPADCYRFVSGNTAADQVPGFIHFCDVELWFYHRNHGIRAEPVHNRPRPYHFTVLNRLHKSWRATVMADFLHSGVLDQSLWSYCETGSIVDEDNPLEIDSVPQLRYRTQQFLNSGPYFADNLTQSQRNDHSIAETKYFTDAYCNIVLETHFDADQSGGAFLSEKTFKPIKHGQLFFIAGTPGSLQQLRDMGYSVFDHCLDNSYDCIENNTQRWQALKQSILCAAEQLPDLVRQAQADLQHNQQLFLASKQQRLNTLIEKLHEPN